MPSRKKKPNNPNAPVAVHRTPYFRAIYSNALKLSSSPAEVRLTFCRLTDNVGEGTGFINEEEICVSVHPAVMRIMIAQMGQLLRNHEKLWGPIDIPRPMLTTDVEALLEQDKEAK